MKTGTIVKTVAPPAAASARPACPRRRFQLR